MENSMIPRQPVKKIAKKAVKKVTPPDTVRLIDSAIRSLKKDIDENPSDECSIALTNLKDAKVKLKKAIAWIERGKTK